MPKLFKASEPRSSPLNMKTTKGLRARLEASAAASGRALTHEAEHRIEQALDFDREFNSLDAASLYNNIGRFLRLFNVSAFKDENYVARACLKSAFGQFIDRSFPNHGEFMPPDPLPAEALERIVRVEKLSSEIAQAVFAASHLDLIAGLKAHKKEGTPRILDSLVEKAELLDDEGAADAPKRRKRKAATE